MPRLHADQVDTSVELVRQLLADQLPEWSDLPVTAVAEHGTDHHLYRLGGDLVARLPIIGWAADQGRSDAKWLPRLAPYLPTAVPAPLALGRPGAGYPWAWSVARWLPGENPTPGNADPLDLARDLGSFVRALRAVDPTDGPAKTGTSRGTPLARLDEGVRRAVAASPRLGALGDRVLTVWEDAVSAPAWAGPPTWLHGDLMAGNLLVRDGLLSAVIDWGALGVGDPAPDLCPAWWLFEGEGREVWRGSAGLDDAAWRRARGWIVAPAVSGIDYYAETFPAMAATALRQLEAVVLEAGA